MFCGGVPLTREHVYAEWMSKHFAGLSGFTATGFIDPDDGDIPMLDPPGADAVRVANANVVREVGASGTMALTVRRVCESCNTGWLSELEAATEPLLAPMFAGLPQLLTGDTATTLATWVLKTVLISTLSFGDPLPLAPFHDLYASRLPSDQTVIWSGYRPDFKLLLHARPLQSKASQGSGVNDGLHGMIILGHVVLGVITKFGTQPLGPVRLPGQQLRAVWPPPPVGDAVWPPPSPMSDALLAQWIDPPYDNLPRPV